MFRSWWNSHTKTTLKQWNKTIYRPTKYAILTDDASALLDFCMTQLWVTSNANGPFLFDTHWPPSNEHIPHNIKKMLFVNFYLLNVALSSLFARKATILYYLQNAPLHTQPRQRECRRCNLIIDGPSVRSWVQEMRFVKDVSSVKNLLSK